MKLVLTHLSVAGKEDAPMLQVEYAFRVPKALWAWRESIVGECNGH